MQDTHTECLACVQCSTHIGGSSAVKKKSRLKPILLAAKARQLNTALTARQAELGHGCVDVPRQICSRKVQIEEEHAGYEPQEQRHRRVANNADFPPHHDLSHNQRRGQQHDLSMKVH